jgi:hypothetical protein
MIADRIEELEGTGRMSMVVDEYAKVWDEYRKNLESKYSK